MLVTNADQMEDLTYGQRIRNYTLEAKVADGSWVTVSNGQSVGHKRIDIFEQPVEASALRLTVLENQASPVYVRFLGGFSPLPRSSAAGR
jgi:alpha-L-fucosidase